MGGEGSAGTSRAEIAGNMGDSAALSAFRAHKKRTGSAALAVIGVVLAIFPFVSDSEFLVFFLALSAIVVILVLSLNIVMSYAGLTSMTHTGLYGVGAYVVAVLAVKYGVDPWLGLVAAVVGTMVFGAITAAVALRAAHMYFAMITFTFNLIILGVVSNWRSVTGGLTGTFGVPRPAIGSYVLSDTTFYYLAVVMLIVSYVGIRNVVRSKYGRSWVALRESHEAASSLGIAPYRSLLIAFTFCSAVAGLAGGLFALLTGFVSPVVADFIGSLILFIGILLGGVGTMVGPVLGASLIRGIEHYVARWAELQVLIFAGILLLAMMVIPRGIVGTWQRSRFGDHLIAGDAPQPENRFSGDMSDVLRHSGEAGFMGGTGEDVHAIRVDRVTKRFGGVVALDGVSMNVGQGTVHGLIGPNGSGKSTLVNLMTGFMARDAGEVLLFGERAPEKAHKAAEAGLVRIFQHPHVFERLSVVENVMVGLHLSSEQGFFQALFRLPAFRRDEGRTRHAAMEILGAAGLRHLADLPASSLSHGQHRLLEVARSLGTNPRVLVLDEPATGLTGEEVVELGNLIRSIRDGGVTVLLIEHNVPFVMSLCDRVTALDEGHLVVEGTPAECQQSKRLLAVYLGEEKD